MNDLIFNQFFLSIKCTLLKKLYSPVDPCLSHRKYFFYDHSLTSVSFQIISSILFWISSFCWRFLDYSSVHYSQGFFFISIKDILHFLALFDNSLQLSFSFPVHTTTYFSSPFIFAAIILFCAIHLIHNLSNLNISCFFIFSTNTSVSINTLLSFPFFL